MVGLDELPDTFTSQRARTLGVHPRDLYAWRDEGEVVELSRGVYRRADAEPATYPDLLAVAYRAPRAVVCCVSAAAVHGLTDEVPVRVQIAVPGNTTPPRIDYPPAKVFRFDVATFDLGATEVEAAPGERIRIYDPARTVTDLFLLRHRLGEPVAHAALNRYLAAPGARPALLLDYARARGVLGPMRSAVDVVMSR